MRFLKYQPTCSVSFMHWHYFFKLMAIVFLAGCQSIANSGEYPNVLIVLVDQQRKDAIGAYGLQPVHTPSLDELASQGVLFENAYVAQPVCAPNRGSLFSGLYPFNHGVRENTWPLDTAILLLPDYLRQHGYISAYFGKWHLGEASRDAFDLFPVYANDGRGEKHYYQIAEKAVYQTEVLAEDAAGFIRDNHDTPTLTVLSFYPPHTPYSVPVYFEDLLRDNFPTDANRRKYYAMGAAIDAAVETVLNTLKELDIHRNTLVIYTTEHGHLFDWRWNRHNKRISYEEASNIPLLIRLPGEQPGSIRTDILINTVDLTPTILGLLGLPVPEPLDGRNLSSSIFDSNSTKPKYTVYINVPYIDKTVNPHRPMFERGEERVVVSGGWKLILSTVRSPELYRLETDPDELDNLWSKTLCQTRIKTMLHYLEEWATDTGDRLSVQLLDLVISDTIGFCKPHY